MQRKTLFHIEATSLFGIKACVLPQMFCPSLLASQNCSLGLISLIALFEIEGEIQQNMPFETYASFVCLALYNLDMLRVH